MKTSSSQSLHRLTEAALIAALYAALTLVLPVASFGPVQFRFGEALTVLCVFGWPAVTGLTLGCAIANAVGVAMGANVAGMWDIFVGTAATFLAAALGYAARRVTVKSFPVLSALWPVLVNGVMVGGLLSMTVFGGLDGATWALTGLQVSAGELVTAVGGGLFLYGMLEKTGISTQFFNKE